MNWKLDEAQEKLPEVIDALAELTGGIASEPQLIFNQDKLVAAIIEPKLFQDFLAWHQQQKASSLANAFAELRQICTEDNYILETPPRCSDRQTPR
ncbi:hypothetical protein [Calothrix sp. 336/3]|uniref:hypothetical protein n=1 Tax=Calothrix sp. 336/3 TaxID=1337936 RepID=UPI0004E4008F|nr:hypothetical protein [Calothrix sp. 336/3]AKG23019.1 prevent-host-death protein [Calothrix sp. 336/3]